MDPEPRTHSNPEPGRHAHHGPDPATSPFTRAAVDAGAISTTYLRAGRGAPVVVLGGDSEGATESRALFVALAEHFRVIAPEMVRAGSRSVGGGTSVTAFSTWLRGFLDGLGILQASLVVREEWALRALGFCLTDPLRVDRLVLCYDDADDPAVCAAAAPDLLGGTGHPLLVRCWRDASPPAPGDDRERDIVRFLLGQDPCAPSADRAG